MVTLSERRKQYQAYLMTEEWKHKAGLVMERDGWVCQSCGEATAVEVHHKTYANIFREPLFDLVAVCRKCHTKLHGL